MNTKQTRRFPFVQMDVFTTNPLEGNQLAVFTNGHGLTSEEMQALAREMNFSETTFILPNPAAKPDAAPAAAAPATAAPATKDAGTPKK